MVAIRSGYSPDTSLRLLIKFEPVATQSELVLHREVKTISALGASTFANERMNTTGRILPNFVQAFVFMARCS